MSVKETIILGMSGGVDSSIALYLLKEQGFDVIGVTLKFFKEQDIETAKKVCQKYKVKHLTINAGKLFQEKIISYFLKEFKQARTPNPCIFCNRDVKIELLLDVAKKEKAQYIATGHYARIKDGLLLQAKDKTKDQTYFLAFLKKRHLSKLIFPLGDYTKQEVYAIAREQKIKVQEMPSQDLCFITNRVTDFLEKRLGKKKGKIIDTKGNVLGEHKGVWFYTIGQRKGIRLAGGPFWVKDFDKNNLIVTKDEKELFSKEVLISNLNFIVKEPKKSIQIKAKIRYKQKLSNAVLKRMGRSPTPPHWKLVFDEPQRAPTPGQIAVFYLPADAIVLQEDKGNLCLGGGVIK